MITGDNPLTACHVARELYFIQKEHTVILQPTPDQSESRLLSLLILRLFFTKKEKWNIECLKLFSFKGDWHWESIDGSVRVPVPPPSLSSFVQEFDLCVTGEGLARLSSNPLLLHTLLPHIRVFARVSPKQKVSHKVTFGHSQLFAIIS